MTKDNNEEVVKVKKSDLVGLVDATVEAYNLLDEAKAQIEDANDKVQRAYKVLEDAPAEVSDIIIEEDEEESDL